MNSEPMKALRDIVGQENVFEYGDKRAETYREWFSVFNQKPKVVEGIAQPSDADELQRCVRLAYERGLAVWTTPNASGNGMMPGPSNKSVLFLDLRRMNRILDVSVNGACALVEPGVSYLQMNDYLRDNDISMWLDCDRNGNNSIAGSITSRQYGYTPYGDHMMMQCGMEVVLGDGNMVRTGTGALPNDKTWQLFKRNFGPYVDGLFSNSTNGIVSKIGFWIMPAPPAYKPFMLALQRQEDIVDIVELLRPLKLNMALPGTVVISHSALDVAPYAHRESFGVDGAAKIDAIRSQHNLGVWNVYGALYGTDRLIDIGWSGVSQAFKNLPDVEIFVDDDRKGDPVWQGREPLMRGNPSPNELDLSGWGGSSYLMLTAAAPQEGRFALQMHDIVRPILDKAGIEYLSEYLLSGRTLFKRLYLPYTAGAVDEIERARATSLKLAEQLTSHGYGIVNESPALKLDLDEQFGASNLDILSQRVGKALDDSQVLTHST